MTKRRICPDCGGIYAAKVDGTMRKHKRFYGTRGYGSHSGFEPCPGSGKPGTPGEGMAR